LVDFIQSCIYYVTKTVSQKFKYSTTTCCITGF
jgi:hypothetical protein